MTITITNTTQDDLDKLDDRIENFEKLVNIKHPYGIWIQDYIDCYAAEHKLEVKTPEDKARLTRFIRAKVLGGVSLFKISLVDMGRIVFAPYSLHETFTSWLLRQEYNPNIQDNMQEIIENELTNRKWLEDRINLKFEGTSQTLCSSTNG